MNFNKESLNKIEVSLGSSDVIIEEYYDNTVKVEVYSDQKKADIPSVKHEGTTLRIVEKNRNIIGFHIGFKSNKIKIYIPKGEVFQYEILTTSGDITSRDIEYLTFESGSTSGEIEFDVKDSTIIDVRSTSGKVSGSAGTGALAAQTISGEIEVKLANMPENGIQAYAVSGEITLELPKNDGYICRRNCRYTDF